MFALRLYVLVWRGYLCLADCECERRQSAPRARLGAWKRDGIAGRGGRESVVSFASC